MSFLKDLVSNFTDSDSQPSGPPPQVPQPWFAEWDSREGRWLFINNDTGDRTYDFPSEYGFSEGAANWAGRKVGEAERFGDDARQDYDNVKYGTEERIDNGINRVEDIPQDIRQDYDKFETRVEGGFDRFADRIENIPQDLSYSAGEAYGKAQQFGQDVGNIPQDVEQSIDRFGDRVEERYDDARDDARRFGDEQEGAFDAGRNQGRGDGW
ncbi:hypothetical protein BDZ85DRAFT_7504 [Elsinoe ampelina]|uniref:WW domain-containing protein n=1 Tax=Elsinoe ampelina TaxID=302913 RepID=A0A6A6GQ28_9PEZI|nr:hypothetical protein BDZ85DRAFT_7504 [Elsinoe ampelina]